MWPSIKSLTYRLNSQNGKKNRTNSSKKKERKGWWIFQNKYERNWLVVHGISLSEDPLEWCEKSRLIVWNIQMIQTYIL